MSDLLKARDVAEMLGLELDTVLDRFQAGDLPGFRLYGRKGGPVRFRRTEIEQCLDAWRHGTMPPHINDPAAPKRPGSGTGGISSHAQRILRPVDE